MWRPQTFRDLVGQPHVRQTLLNALSKGRVAHAYLFCGPRGTGKTSAAKILAKAVNCLQPVDGEPCNACEACVGILRGNNVDVEEIDAASNRGVDEIRQLRDKVQYAPATLKRKVYIIDEVHMLTTEAFNALLKTLEEPPAHVLFVLATTEPHKIPGTIVSRCQRFDFRRIAPELIVERMKEVCAAEGWNFEDEALWKIAQAADGGLRDALGILEQTVAFGGGIVNAENAAHVMGGVESQLLLELILCLWRQDIAGALQLLGNWYENGKDAGRIVHELLQVFRDLVIVKMSSGSDLPGHLQSARLQEAGKTLTVPWLMEGIDKLGETYVNLRFLDDPRLALEAALLMLSPVQKTVSPAQLQDGSQSVAQTAAQSASPETSPNPPKLQAASEESGKGNTLDDNGRTSGQSELAPTRTRKVNGRLGNGNGRDADARKREALHKLLSAADEQQLSRLRQAWPDVLSQVKDLRVQTHAWLMNGEPMLATGSVVVLAFSSKFHRETVMKPEERSVIEQALTQVMGSPQQIFALLRQDWEKYGPSAIDEEQEQPDLVETAVRVFGKDVVEIIDGE